MIDNTEKLKSCMSFSNNSYYKFVVLLREKDGDTILKGYDKKEIVVRQWLIESEEALFKLLPDMLVFADIFKGRLYMATDRKAVNKTLFKMQERTMEYIKQFSFGENCAVSVKALNKILASSSSSAESSDKNSKRWLYDVDTKDVSILEKTVAVCGEHYMETFETPNGYHVLADRKYDAVKRLNDNPIEMVEVKDNSLLLVYKGG